MCASKLWSKQLIFSCKHGFVCLLMISWTVSFPDEGRTHNTVFQMHAYSCPLLNRGTGLLKTQLGK